MFRVIFGVRHCPMQSRDELERQLAVKWGRNPKHMTTNTLIRFQCAPGSFLLQLKPTININVAPNSESQLNRLHCEANESAPNLKKTLYHSTANNT